MRFLPTLARSVSVAVDAAAICVGALCAACALASLGGAFSERLDLLAQLAAMWLLGSGLVAAHGLLTASPGRRKLIAGIGALGVVASGWQIAPELTRPIRPAQPSRRGYRIKLIEYNAWGRNPTVPTDVDWLVRQQPDFILMTDTAAAAKAALAARGFVYIKGVADTAIFSRQARAPETYVIPALEWPLLPSFSRGTFMSPGGPFTIVATHLQRPTTGGQPEGRQALLRLLDQYDRRRLIVAGDFNLTPWSFGLRGLDRQIGLERRDRAIATWPALYSPVAFLPIDHVYAGEAWRTVSIERGPRLGSDHYPLIVTLALDS